MEDIELIEGKMRELWIDNVKVIACVLVVLGHFFQSMTKSGILPSNNLYNWFNQTIYFFHVPLFFICSGYLYQKYNNIQSFASWRRNVLKKAIVLGTPYTAFTIVTWTLKTVFSNAVNNEIGGLFQTLVLSPTPPYWYLYVLFLLFLVTPTFSGKKMANIGLGIGLSFKILNVYFGDIYAISGILSNEIWFVSGMYLCISGSISAANTQKWFKTGCILAIVFFALSIIVYRREINFPGMDFLFGMTACIAIVLITVAFSQDNFQVLFFRLITKYTMPIFLMHTIFAASVRIILLKAEIYNTAVHIILGLTISIAGPILATNFMKRLKWLEFFLYPGKFIKL